jgi:hypothetical protein
VFNRYACDKKKVVGVFVRFRAPLVSKTSEELNENSKDSTGRQNRNKLRATFNLEVIAKLMVRFVLGFRL